MAQDESNHALQPFARWLALRRNVVAPVAADPSIAAAARTARDAYLGAREDAKLEQRIGTHFGRESIQLLAAADEDGASRLPRMRTPRGFAILPIYRLGSQPGQPPSHLLIECPTDLVDLVVGEVAYFFMSGRRFELGKFDRDGKANGPLPADIELKPPFGFSVGQFTEDPTPEGDGA